MGNQNLADLTEPKNLSLVVTASASALTIAVKGDNGTDPSASNQLWVSFRNVTESSGNNSWIGVKAATSLVISSGSTMGVTSATAFRMWVVGFNDAGTFRLGAINCCQSNTTNTQIFGLASYGVASSTAEGGAGAADSAGIIYTGTAVTSAPYKILGFAEWGASGLATAGTWTTTNLLRVVLWQPGMHKPGDILQSSYLQLVFNESTTSSTYIASTAARISITPTSAANIIRLYGFLTGDNKAARSISAIWARGTTNNTGMIGNYGETYGEGARSGSSLQLFAVDMPNVTASQTYCIQFSSQITGSVSLGFNDYNSLYIEEVMV